MSVEEIEATLAVLRADLKKQEEEDAKKQAALPKEPPLPPLSEFEYWYDNIQKSSGAWMQKRRKTHLFVYEMCHLGNSRRDGKSLDALFKARYGHEPEISATKVFEKYDKPAMEAFKEWLAQKNAKEEADMDTGVSESERGVPQCKKMK